MDTIREAPRETPVAADVDVCVVGGSCTGVFAAVAAARLGAKVALVELNGFFGGVATASMVNVWHSLHDTTGQRQIIGGLTAEVIERLDRRDAVLHHDPRNRSKGVELNSEVLKLELDVLVTERRATESWCNPRESKRIASPKAESRKDATARVCGACM